MRTKLRERPWLSSPSLGSPPSLIDVASIPSIVEVNLRSNVIDVILNAIRTCLPTIATEPIALQVISFWTKEFVS